MNEKTNHETLKSLLATGEELMKSLPDHLTLTERRQIRDFIESLLRLRPDEINDGSSITDAFRYIDTGAHYHRNYEESLQYFSEMLERRQDSESYKDDLEGFRELESYTGTEWEKTIDDKELATLWERQIYFGFAKEWDHKLAKFNYEFYHYCLEGDNHSTSLTSPALATLYMLCMPLFNESYARTILQVWPAFSSSFSAIHYTKKTWQECSEFEIGKIKSGGLYF